jgi:hypothetical protein
MRLHERGILDVEIPHIHSSLGGFNMTLKDQLILELKGIQPQLRGKPRNLETVMRAGSIVVRLRERYKVSDAEMIRILKSESSEKNKSLNVFDEEPADNLSQLRRV